MSRPIVPLGALALAVAILGVACSSEPSKESNAAKPGAASDGAAADTRPAKVPIMEGYTYYVGGPFLKKDAFGRDRIAKFLGEVAQPPGRGMVIGAKRDGDRLEYRVWVNGRAIGVYRGVMKDGVFWREYAETYRNERTVAREFSVNDDAAQLIRVKMEDVDPASGETIRTTETTTKYQAPVLAPLPDDPEDPEDESSEEPDEADAKTEQPGQPAPPAVKGAEAAPVPVAPAAK